MKMKAFLPSVAACLCLGALAELSAPELSVTGYINGTMNVVVVKVDGVSYEIEMKGPDDSGYAAVAFREDGSLNAQAANPTPIRFFYLSTNYVGEASFRIRAVSNGMFSEWTDCGTHKATLNATGTLISSAAANAVNVQSPDNAVDGRLRTFCDFTSDSGNDKWVGWLYDSDIAIKAIRFLPRRDLIYGRYRESLFQAASDASFSDATNIYRISSSYENGSSIVEVPLDPPVRARAFRHYKEKGGYEQTAELEFIPVEMPLKPVLSIASCDMTNFHPVISISFPALLRCSSFRIERAFQKGSWTVLKDWTDAADVAPFTDVSTYVGIPAYYRVAAVTKHPDWEDNIVYSAISTYTRVRRLDRAWSDETKLLDGLTLMTQTNGTANAKQYGYAFDGDTSTKPDTYKPYNADGPVGLDFGQNVWLCGFGYVCRNDSYCFQRIKFAALYCASGEDVELRDKIQCSANVARYSQDTTFYYQAATNCPTAGARCWFLYGNWQADGLGGFYGNVAELAFFGWTQADLDKAPFLNAPDVPTFVRGEGSVTLAWNAVRRAVSYAVQRRLRGSENWETRAEGLTETAYVDEIDTDADAAVYEYRIEANGGELGTAVSDVARFFHYRLGNGTGLQGAAWWPYSRTSCAMDQLSNVAARGVEAVNLAVSSDAELAPGVTAGVKFVWTGKVVCPLAGTYRFRLDADAGGCIRIDGYNTANNAMNAPSGVFTLAKGEHSIRVEYLCTGTTGTRTCRLLWSGPMDEEVVPASQLLPDDETAQPSIDGWDVDVFGQNRCNFFEKAEEGVYRFTSGCGTWTSVDSGNYQFMSRPWSGNFDFSATIYAKGYGYMGLMVRDAEGHAYYPYTVNQWNVMRCGVWGIPSGATQRTTLVGDVEMASNIARTYLRLTRVGPVFTVYTRKSANEEWVEHHSWTDAAFPRETWIGIAMTAWPSSPDNLFIDEVSDIELKPYMQPTVLIFR